MPDCNADTTEEDDARMDGLVESLSELANEVQGSGHVSPETERSLQLILIERIQLPLDIAKRGAPCGHRRCNARLTAAALKQVADVSTRFAPLIAAQWLAAELRGRT